MAQEDAGEVHSVAVVGHLAEFEAAGSARMATSIALLPLWLRKATLPGACGRWGEERSARQDGTRQARSGRGCGRPQTALCVRFRGSRAAALSSPVSLNRPVKGGETDVALGALPDEVEHCACGKAGE